MEQGEFEASAPRAVEPSVVIKRKGSKGLLISTIVLGVIAVGLGVFLTIMLLNPPKKDVACGDKDGTEEVVENPDENKTEEPTDEPAPTPERKSTDARIGYVVDGSCARLYLTKSGEVYADGGGGCNMFDNAGAIVTVSSTSNDTGTVGNYSISEKEIPNYFMGGSEDSAVKIENGLKVNESGVVAIAAAQIGQNWTGDIFVLVKEDGTIDILYMMAQFQSSSFKATLEKSVGGFKNIASAVPMDGGDHVSTMLITRNGGHISLEDTLNNWLSQNN
jgi:hypothetical protein